MTTEKKAEPSPQVHVLIVDDEKVVCDALARRLRENGFTITVAYNGVTALQLIQEQCFDVALIDIRMPKIDGFGVLRGIRERCPDAKAIMMTAYADIRSAVDSISSGAVDIVSKPVDIDEVIITIRRSLG